MENKINEIKSFLDAKFEKDILPKSVDVKLNENTLEAIFSGEGLTFDQKMELEKKVLNVLSEEFKEKIKVKFIQAAPPVKVEEPKKPKRIIAVASGKGGVGKSSVSVYLSLALKELGFSVGLLDADIYGPSIPRMLGVMKSHVYIDDHKKLIPVLSPQGIKVVSFGFFVEEADAVIWRGPMLHNTIRQFVNEVDWGDVDYLIVDLPPGTGDVQLSLCQTIALDGAVIVTTPQMVAVSDAIKGISMFEKLKTPILGIVENMTYFLTESGKKIEIFGKGGADYLAQKKNSKVLGRIPLSENICNSLDEGKPFPLNDVTDPIAVAFKNLAKEISGKNVGFLSKLKEKLL